MDRLSRLDLSKDSWIHFVAIGGKGMGALASALASQGFCVTGSDGPLYPPMSLFLDKAPLKYTGSYDRENLKGSTWGLGKDNPDLIVVGNAISAGHVEAEAARELFEKGLAKRLSFSEALAEFAIRGNESFVVAGTHGKSTSSSMMAWAMERCGYHPGFFIGAIPSNFEQPCRMAQTPQFISEGDEYDTVYWSKISKFLYYLPDWVVCTGIEFDHADIFKDLEAIEKSFLELVARTKKGWVLVENESAPVASSVEKIALSLKERKLPCLRYGFHEGSDYRITNYAPVSLASREAMIGMRFDLSFRGEMLKTFQSSMIGKHNLLNATGVLAALHASGLVEFEKIPSDIFEDYLGIAKRQQELFSNEATVVVDDFAHHPRAIKETLSALKLRYPQRWIRVFFEPRSATSARNLLLEDFKQCFVEADEIYLVNATKENVPVAERLDVDSLKAALEKGAKKVHLSREVEGLFESFKKRESKEKELVVLMSNASFGGLAAKILSTLKS